MVLTQDLFDEVIDDIKNGMEEQFLYVNVGTDDTTATSADTSLGTEVFRTPIQSFDKSAPTEVVISGEIGAGDANGNTIVEVGNNTASSSGTQLTRNVVNPITKTSDVVLYLDTSISIEVTEG